MRRIALAVALTTAPAPLAAQTARWEPGEPTTSRVRGEVSESRRSSSGDGVYGRFEGDFDLGVGLGLATLGDTGLGAARTTLHYFSTAGIAATYADALGQDREFSRFASFGVSLKPLFLARWSEDYQQGPATLDLLIDSAAIGIGAFFAEPSGDDFGSTRGFELSLGLGLPFTGRASGPWLEVAYLWRWANPGSASEGTDHGLLAVLSWHALFLSSLTD